MFFTAYMIFLILKVIKKQLMYINSVTCKVIIVIGKVKK